MIHKRRVIPSSSLRNESFEAVRSYGVRKSLGFESGSITSFHQLSSEISILSQVLLVVVPQGILVLVRREVGNNTLIHKSAALEHAEGTSQTRNTVEGCFSALSEVVGHLVLEVLSGSKEVVSSLDVLHNDFSSDTSNLRHGLASVVPVETVLESGNSRILETGIRIDKEEVARLNATAGEVLEELQLTLLLAGVVLLYPHAKADVSDRILSSILADVLHGGVHDVLSGAYISY